MAINREEFTPFTLFENDKVRPFEYRDQEFTVKARDPYGYWYISMKGKSVPDKLKGAYTGYSFAEADIRSYMDAAPRTAHEKAVAKAPALKGK